MNKERRFRKLLLAALGVVLVSTGKDYRPAGATPAPTDDPTLYVMPISTPFLKYTDAEFSGQVADLRRRLPEMPGVKVGFTTYVDVTMQNADADPDDRVAIRAGLADTISTIDRVIARARANNLGVTLSLITPIRSATDAYQAAAQLRDRRNMQWYSDNAVADGWISFSRYARRQHRVLQASIEELGKVLANRMALYPETVWFATGDGETELSIGRASDPATAVLADYSPFAIAEFRDWLTGRGLYAAGQPFAGEAYEQSSRYALDATPATDESGDGHTLNGDFGTSFDTWNLKHFDWSLNDSTEADPHAIPSSVYSLPDFDPFRVTHNNGFDAPRTRSPLSPWLDIWHTFRATLVWRYNRDFARALTTTIDPATGATIPATKFFSYQVPADYIFNGTPDAPNERLEFGASHWWTADVTPYGGMGFTSFNLNVAGDPLKSFFTLRNLAPVVGARNVRWALLEWNPAVQDGGFNPVFDNLAFYREDMALVERYAATLLVPFSWENPSYPFRDTGFETAVKELMARVSTRAMWLTDKSDFRFSAVRGSAGVAVTAPQEMVLRQVGYQAREWTITSSQPWLKVSRASGVGNARISVSVDPANAPLSGTSAARLSIAASDGSGTAPVTVSARLSIMSLSAGPFGAIDTPADNSLALSGSVAVTGWALDDVDVTRVEIWRDANSADPAAAAAPPGTLQAGKIFVGTTTSVDGSRPDVASLYAAYPRASRAGWGYLMLTRGLIWDGNGPFRIYAYAYDADGHVSSLGSKLVGINNAVATRPFGAIDTPNQGEAVSGLVNNFGWVIAKPGRTIPEQNVIVYIDGVAIGSPGGLTSRPDLTPFAAQGFDVSRAARVLTFDSRTLSDGMHTIGWLVTDSAGEADGIGSRFFRVLNAVSSLVRDPSDPLALLSRPPTERGKIAN